MRIESLPTFKEGKKAIDQNDPEGERVLDVIRKGPIKVEVDRKRGIMRHIWPLFTAVTILTGEYLYFNNREDPGEIKPRQTTTEVKPTAPGAETGREAKPKVSDTEIGRDEDCIKMERELTDSVPGYIIEMIKDRVISEKSKLKGAADQTDQAATRISGFERIDSDTPYLMSAILNEDNGFYPRNWLRGKVSEINYVTNTPGQIPKKYGKNSAASTMAGKYDRPPKSITLYTNEFNLIGKPMASYVLDHIIAHELGHANDWISNSTLSYKERLSLLKSVISRLGQRDRFESSYVESIKLDDKKEENIRKATEYWAEICEAYFRSLQFNKGPDFDLVEGIVRKTDPNYKKSAAESASYEVHRLSGKKEPMKLTSGGKEFSKDEIIKQIVGDLKKGEFNAFVN